MRREIPSSLLKDTASIETYLFVIVRVQITGISIVHGPDRVKGDLFDASRLPLRPLPGVRHGHGPLPHQNGMKAGSRTRG